MTATPQLFRKLDTLRKRVEEALTKKGFDNYVLTRFEPDAVEHCFARWAAIRDELVKVEPELDDLPPAVASSPETITEDYAMGTAYKLSSPLTFIPRRSLERLRDQIADAWDILNHPTRQLAQVSIDREGVFVGGQPFDAMLAITSIVRAATTSIAIVDGYVSDHTLSLLGVKADTVAARILTLPSPPRKPAEWAAFVTAAKAFNAQTSPSPPLEVRTSSAFHDRFIAVDDVDFYHFGHSLKDAARRQAFMFSRIEEPVVVAAIRNTIAKEWTAGTIVVL